MTYVLTVQVGIIWRHVASRNDSSCRTLCRGMSFRLAWCLGQGLRGFARYSGLVLHTEKVKSVVCPLGPLLCFTCAFSCGADFSFWWLLENLEAPQPHPQKYHWQEHFIIFVSFVSFLSRQTRLLLQQKYACSDNTFGVTNICLTWLNFCHDKNILLRQT